MDYEKAVHVDIDDMGKRFGVEPREVILPNGSKFMGTLWSKEALQKGVSETAALVGDAEGVIYHGRCSSYVMAAMAHLAFPRPCCQFIPPHGENMDGEGFYEHFYKLEIGDYDPAGHVRFDVREDGDRVYIDFYVEDGTSHGHAYDINDLPKLKIPSIPEGKHVMLAGRGLTSIAISVAEGYADIAKSMSMLYGTETDYVCAYSNCNDVGVGDKFPA